MSRNQKIGAAMLAVLFVPLLSALPFLAGLKAFGNGWFGVAAFWTVLVYICVASFLITDRV